MKIQPLELPGLKLVQLKIFGDSRGFFVERFNINAFKEAEMPTSFYQDNHSRSQPGVVRGLHYQWEPAQGKLVSVVRGRIWDVAVDIRSDSPSFGKWMGVELSDQSGKMLWIPKGFAHGFCVLGDEPADVIYKVDQLYNPDCEGGLHWADSDLAIDWPLKNPTVSERDRALPGFQDFQSQPVKW